MPCVFNNKGGRGGVVYDMRGTAVMLRGICGQVSGKAWPRVLQLGTGNGIGISPLPFVVPLTSASHGLG